MEGGSCKATKTQKLKSLHLTATRVATATRTQTRAQERATGPLHSRWTVKYPAEGRGRQPERPLNLQRVHRGTCRRCGPTLRENVQRTPPSGPCAAGEKGPFTCFSSCPSRPRSVGKCQTKQAATRQWQILAVNVAPFQQHNFGRKSPTVK